MKFKKKIYGDPIVNTIIAECEGQKTHSRPYAYISDEFHFSHITGGVVLPTFDMPGFLLTVGVNFNDHIINCIDEYENKDPYKIIKKAQQIQKEYGPDVIQNWWGNPEELISLVNEINIDGNPIHIAAPINSNEKDAFQIYLSRLRVALSPEYQTFYINNCDRLRNYISSFVPADTEKGKNNPALYLSGALLHTLLLMRPWEQEVKMTELVPTTFEDFAVYENKQAEKEIYREIYGVEI